MTLWRLIVDEENPSATKLQSLQDNNQWITYEEGSLLTNAALKSLHNPWHLGTDKGHLLQRYEYYITQD